jgi:hypothetical protein
MRRLASALLALVVVSACSTPPDKERGQADGAIAAARAASADVYAAEELAAAEAALSQYDTAVAQRDFRQALNAALTARDRAYEAAKRASTAKAEARGTAERLAGELAAQLDGLAARLAGTATPRVPAAQVARLRRAVTTARESLQEARTEIEREAYPKAITALEAALAAIAKEIDAASTRTR